MIQQAARHAGETDPAHLIQPNHGVRARHAQIERSGLFPSMIQA
jgi:hypothetical protein